MCLSHNSYIKLTFSTTMKRLTVDVPEELMERLDAYCQENFINRTNAVRQWIRTLPLEKPIKKRKTKKESSSQT